MKQRKTITTEATLSAETLRPKSGPHDGIDICDDAEKAIEIYSKLNADQRKRFNDHWQGALDSSAVWKKGPDHSPQNKKFIEATKEKLELTFEEMGFSKESQQKCAELFEAAVHGKSDHFRKTLGELLQNYSPSPFISDEDLSAVELLANRIEALESSIAAVDEENAELAKEIYDGLCKEEVKPPQRKMKVSTVQQYLEEVDPENQIFLEDHDQHSGDPFVRKYLEGFK